MARKISEIYDALNLAKQNMAELGVCVNNDAESLDTAKKLVNDVRSGSRVAVWRLWLWIMAVATWVIENTQEAHETRINTILAAKKPHTLRWYAEQTKLWQYGYEIEWHADHFAFSRIDESARIVAYASAAESDGHVVIKVLRANRQPLTPEELEALKAFWSKYKDAGVSLSVISSGVTDTWFQAIIHRNRNIINEDNTLIANPTYNAVRQPADDYIAGLDFDGAIYYSKLIQDIIDQPGIISVVLQAVHIDEGSVGPPGSWIFYPQSGFAAIVWEQCQFTYIDSYV